jgi:hypothetical protein
MKKLHVCAPSCHCESPLIVTGNHSWTHRLQPAVPRPPQADIRLRSQEAYHCERSPAASLVQGVAHGRRHRSAQNPVREGEEGSAARTRATVSGARPSSLLSDVRQASLLGRSGYVPQRRRKRRRYGDGFGRLLLHIYCIYDSDMTHRGPRSLAGLVGVECQCYLGYRYLVFCY